ncbi:hypothetical protein MTO96_004111 [Rhipicephalus appendiculatus]
MFAQLLVLALASAAYAGFVGPAAVAAPVVAKAVVQDVYAAQPYKFGYEVNDGHGNHQSRHEVADAHNNRVGSYSFTDNYGRHRSVHYVADGHGFRASVKTNEPGTAASHPAGAYFSTPRGSLLTTPPFFFSTLLSQRRRNVRLYPLSSTS